MTLYFFMLRLNDCGLVWSQTSSTNLKRLLVFQHRALKKIMLGLERTNSSIVQSQAMVLQMHQIYVKQLLIFMFECDKGL